MKLLHSHNFNINKNLINTKTIYNTINTNYTKIIKFTSFTKFSSSFIACLSSKHFSLKISNNFTRTITIKDYINKYNNITEPLNDISESVAGRVLSIRTLSKNLSFLDLSSNGVTIQIAFLCGKNSKSNIDLNDFKSIKRGDIIGLEGNPFKTKTGELSLLAQKLHLLSPYEYKNELPILNRENSTMLKNFDTRYSKRYLDLIVNNHHKNYFFFRANIIKFLRNFLESRDFLEVETPVLSRKAGGAIARPFVTHANHLKTDLYLRIAPELYLKQLIIAGFEKVFEIGKNFRNEQITIKHNPEFTTCEFYEAYSDYLKLMKMTQQFLKELVISLFGKPTVTINNIDINFEDDFQILDVFVELEKYFDTKIERIDRGIFEDQINKIYKEYEMKNRSHSITTANNTTNNNKTELTLNKKIEILIEDLIEVKCNKPSFIIHHPIMLSPLTKSLNDQILVSERFEFYINKIELINAYSELNCHKEQKLRFEEQLKNNKSNSNNTNTNEKEENSEFHPMDMDFVDALSHGMPPTAGFGIGIDRLTMILLGLDNIKEVILFPLMNVNV